MKTGMWSWVMSKVPFQSYLLGFVIGDIVVGVFELLNIKTVKSTAARLFWVQLVFFIVLNFIL